MLGLTLAWPRSEPLQVIARAELGALFFDGAQRYLGNLGVGARLTPWRDWPVSPWLQLGLGTLGHVEHISVALPERVVSDTALGVSFSVDAAIGVRFARCWEFGFAWDHIVWLLPYYEVYTGAESLPYRGTALTWIGVEL